MGKAIPVWLVDNGAYWKAAWPDPESKTGKRYKSLGPKAKIGKRQAQDACRALSVSLGRPQSASTGAPRLSAWFDRYFNMRVDVGAETRDMYRHCAAYLLAYFTADPPIDTITRAQTGDWFAAMLAGNLTVDLNAREVDQARDTGKIRYKWRKLSLSTIRRHARTAKQVFQAAVDEDRIQLNPFDRIKSKAPKPLKTWREVTQDELWAIVDACPTQAWKNLFALCRLAGVRRNEALTLEWPDINWDGNRMSVNEGIDRETTKKRIRTCPLEPARCPTGLTKFLLESAKSTGLVCAGVSTNNLRRNALVILEHSGVGAYAKPFHTLRKCRISEVALEYPQGILEEWFGHDEDVSRIHYQRVPEELYRKPRSVQRGHNSVSKPRTKRVPTAAKSAEIARAHRRKLSA